MSMASSSVAARCRYDIFLSFRSEDARRGFVRHLDSALCVAGFRTFLDDAELWNVENISLQMERAVEESKLSIVVISRKYASSLWFLDILLKILECKEKLGQQVIPIFLDVDPSEALGILFQVFAKHDKRNEADSRLALHMFGNIKGWDLHNVENHWTDSIGLFRVGSLDNRDGLPLGWLGHPIFRDKEGHELLYAYMLPFFEIFPVNCGSL